MQAVQQAAYISVGRASGFAGLAIVCFMAGFSYDPVLAARVGACGALLTALILALRADRALCRPYHKTETWLILANDQRPPGSLAQKIVGTALREAYAWYGRAAALAAMGLGAASPILALLGSP